MTYSHKTLILFLPILFFGCQILAPIDTKQGTSDVKIGEIRKVSQKLIDEWFADKKYTKVLGSLESVPDSKRTQKDRNQIENIKKLAKEYDRQQSEVITKLYKDGKRMQALKLLDEAFNNYSDGSRLWVIKEKINQQQLNYMRELESQILLAKGEWLLQSSPLYKELVSVNPGDKDLIFESKQVAGNIIATATRLTTLGIHALSTGEYQLAEQRLNMANVLNPTSDNIIALARLDKLSHEKKLQQRKLIQIQEEIKRRVETKKSVEVQRKKLEQNQKESTRLVEKIYHSLAREELVQASQQIKVLKNKYNGHSDMPRLQDSLNKSITQRVNALLVEGSELYGNGQIEKAKGVWELALKLDPENSKIKSRVKRAQQVLNKLRELQNRKPQKAN